MSKKMHLQTFVSKMPKYHHQRISKLEMGYLWPRSGLTHSTASSVVFPCFLCPLACSFYYPG